jgi:hypothetical protein
MPNGRCRVRGGASTGPKSPEGKARVVAAMVEGRRAWAERVRANGGRFAAGRKSGAEWVTESMRETATAEARKLTGGCSLVFRPQDRKLVLALLRSANGSPEGRARAKALLAASKRDAEEEDIKKAEQIIRERILDIDDRVHSKRF